MAKLTLDRLKNMEPHTIFASGKTSIPHPWYNSSGHYPKDIDVRWIAIRGGIHDWAIYHSFDTNLEFYADFGLEVPNELIASHGAKLHDMKKVAELVDCDDEALKMYRH